MALHAWVVFEKDRRRVKPEMYLLMAAQTPPNKTIDFGLLQ
jgi:hypothetical protein